jgi:glycosyltransferase involved in cell wall biosynthesis
MLASIVFISHEATLTGAPILLLHLLEALRPLLKEEFIVVLGKDGPLRSRFEQVATVLLYEQAPVSRWHAALLRRLNLSSAHQAAHQQRLLKGKNVALVFSNTIVNGRFLTGLSISPQVPIITYVHELSFTFEMQQQMHGDVDQLMQRTTYFLAGSNAVRQVLLSRGVTDNKIQVIYSSIQFAKLTENLAALDVVAIRQELKLYESDQLVVAIGTANWRKGTDWFLQMAARLAKQRPNVRFAWVGVSPRTTEHMQMRYDIERYGLAEQVILVPVTPNYLAYLALADVFVLTSREDPFPLVVLEAAAAGKPIVCFASAGGASEFVGTKRGIIAPYGDVVALADAVESLLADPVYAQALGSAAHDAVRHGHTTTAAAERIRQLLNKFMNAQN